MHCNAIIVVRESDQIWWELLAEPLQHAQMAYCFSPLKSELNELSPHVADVEID
jgi:hypothetical protein